LTVTDNKVCREFAPKQNIHNNHYHLYISGGPTLDRPCIRYRHKMRRLLKKMILWIKFTKITKADDRTLKLYHKNFATVHGDEKMLGYQFRDRLSAFMERNRTKYKQSLLHDRTPITSIRIPEQSDRYSRLITVPTNIYSKICKSYHVFRKSIQYPKTKRGPVYDFTWKKTNKILLGS